MKPKRSVHETQRLKQYIKLKINVMFPNKFRAVYQLILNKLMNAYVVPCQGHSVLDNISVYYFLLQPLSVWAP